MNQKQNKTTFAAIVIIAIIAGIGLIGTSNFGVFNKIWYFTGFSTTALGTATINISSELAIRLIDANISFGNGTVDQAALFAILESNGTAAVNGSWVAVNDPFVLENDGNVLANVTIKAGTSAANWIGGNVNYAAMFYKYGSNETNSCLLESGIIKNQTWASLPVTPLYNETCQKLNFTDSSDTIRVDMKIQIPSDAAPGTKENSITFTSSQSA